MIVASPLTPLENILRSVLDWLHAPAHFPSLTWAWSIVALTLIVRLLLVPLMVKQIHSMQNLQRHAPQMKEIFYARSEELPQNQDYVLVVRPGLAEAAESRGFDWLTERVEEILGKAAA